MPRKRIERNVTRARQLRSALSLPEALLWRLLKGSPAGVHIRSQHPIGTYVLDFYCAKAKIAFEIDGKVHDMGDHPEHDVQRDAWLRGEGTRLCASPPPKCSNRLKPWPRASCGTASAENPSVIRLQRMPPPRL